MDGFFVLLGHLVGDYILQNDWMASNKTNPHPGNEPHPSRIWVSCTNSVGDDPDLTEQREWWARRDHWHTGHLACTVHCLLYTAAVWLFTFWWMPWWGLLVCFVCHWPIDRFRLAKIWMVHVSRQKVFATGPLAPWSIIIVDNIFHLLTLGAIAAVAR